MVCARVGALGAALTIALFALAAPDRTWAAPCVLDTNGDGTATNGVDSVGGAVAAPLTSTACGNGATASASSTTAIGSNSNASRDFSTAVGANSTASGFSSTAIGTGSTASANNSTALGVNTQAGFVNSTAIGQGATTTAAHQVMVGTAINTYALPGIASAASAAAQSGPVQFVTTDAAGNLSTDGGAAFAGISSLMEDVRKSSEGVAIALALDAPYVPPGQVVAFSGSYGNFEGFGALALSGAARVHESVQVDAGFGYGLRNRSLGGRVGVTVGW